MPPASANKGQVTKGRCRGLPQRAQIYCQKGQQAQVWAVTPTAQVPKLGLYEKCAFVTELIKLQRPCKWRNGIAAGLQAGSVINTQVLTSIKAARQRGCCAVRWSLCRSLYGLNYCLLPGCLHALDRACPVNCIMGRCAWPVLCACCNLLSSWIDALCTELVHDRCQFNCAVGNQPTLPASGWMIGRDGYALFVWHLWAPA